MCIDSEDAKNAVISFFNKEKPEWKGRYVKSTSVLG